MENPQTPTIHFQQPAETTPESATGKITRSIKRNIYRWHRLIGIITVIPVICWTLSGAMHPFMAHWFKPAIPHESVAPIVIPKEQILLSIQDVLRANHVAAIRNFRIVYVNNQWYYQVKTESDTLVYFSTGSGKRWRSAICGRTGPVFFK